MRHPATRFDASASNHSSAAGAVNARRHAIRHQSRVGVDRRHRDRLDGLAAAIRMAGGR
ncbi:hypothetical protein [Saccharothrix longispora]|uniref:hypothetical protein n=1 Tax=Saccharothrix longispora TaxID=33920 RepID=UPI0028FD24FD|nr:hypothetical protein [Saccharothrix longispora]MDU0293030.1 hypothetical protein [Saccharothrix longispora]